MEVTNWLSEHSAALRDLRARGMSYSEIADTINAKFSTSYTRNATPVVPSEWGWDSSTGSNHLCQIRPMMDWSESSSSSSD